MSYRIKPNASIPEEAVRIITKELDRLTKEWSDTALELEERIHQVRKRCKRIRGVLRLVRPALGDAYRRENHRYRDLARSLSEIRDTAALIDAYDDVMESYEKEVERPRFASLRRDLTLRKQRIQQEHADTEPMHRQILKTVEEGRAALPGLFDSRDSNAVNETAQGLQKTYRRARKALEKAHKKGESQSLHELRKRAKYQFFQYRLLQDFQPDLFRGYRKAFKQLSDSLGQDRDLLMLDAYLDDASTPLDKETTQDLKHMIHQSRQTHRARSVRLGDILCSDKPKSVRRRIEAALVPDGTRTIAE